MKRLLLSCVLTTTFGSCMGQKMFVCGVVRHLHDGKQHAITDLPGARITLECGPTLVEVSNHPDGKFCFDRSAPSAVQAIKVEFGNLTLISPRPGDDIFWWPSKAFSLHIVMTGSLYEQIVKKARRNNAHRAISQVKSLIDTTADLRRFANMRLLNGVYENMQYNAMTEMRDGAEIATTYAVLDSSATPSIVFNIFSEYLTSGYIFPVDFGNEKLTSLTRTSSSTAYLLQGRVFETFGETENATSAFKKSFSILPNDATKRALSNFYARRKQYSIADSLSRNQIKGKGIEAVDSISNNFDLLYVNTRSEYFFPDAAREFSLRIISKKDSIRKSLDPVKGSFLIKAEYILANQLTDSFSKNQVFLDTAKALIREALEDFKLFGEGAIDSFGIWTSGKGHYHLLIAKAQITNNEKWQLIKKRIKVGLRTARRKFIRELNYRNLFELEYNYYTLLQLPISQQFSFKLLNKERRKFQVKNIPVWSKLILRDIGEFKKTSQKEFLQN